MNSRIVLKSILRPRNSHVRFSHLSIEVINVPKVLSYQGLADGRLTLSMSKSRGRHYLTFRVTQILPERNTLGYAWWEPEPTAAVYDTALPLFFWYCFHCNLDWKWIVDSFPFVTYKLIIQDNISSNNLTSLVPSLQKLWSQQNIHSWSARLLYSNNPVKYGNYSRQNSGFSEEQVLLRNIEFDQAFQFQKTSTQMCLFKKTNDSIKALQISLSPDIHPLSTHSSSQSLI